jgi:hypothetical protein
MPTIFKNIRRKLAGENKVTGYLRYALGEILLVVIGILIALQVNNWNAHRKQKKQEKLLFVELINNLSSDINDLRHNLRVDSATIKSQEIVLTHIENKLSYNDSLAFHFGRMTHVTQFLNNESAYENIKSIGFNTIENDSIKYKIIKYYATDSYELTTIEKSYIIGPEISYIEPFMISNFDYSSMFNPAYPDNYNHLLNDPKFKSMVATSARYFKWKDEKTRDCLRAAERLRSDLQKLVKESQ